MKLQEQLNKRTESKQERKPIMNFVHVVKGDTEKNCTLKEYMLGFGGLKLDCRLISCLKWPQVGEVRDRDDLLLYLLIL